jgi:hypothetical protein
MSTLEITHLRRPINHFAPIDPETPFVPKFRWDPDKVETAIISRYADDILDLDIGIPQINVPSSDRYIDFKDYEESIREIVRAYAWCGMNYDHSAFEGDAKSIAPVRLKKDLLILRRYLHFMSNHTSGKITDKDNNAWLAQSTDRSYSTRLRASMVPRRLYWYRHRLPINVMESQPWSDRTVSELLGPPPQLDENATERVPREIIEPMMRWALFYVNIAAKDIFSVLKMLPRHDDLNWRHLNLKFAFSRFPETSVPWQSAKDYVPGKEVRMLVVACYILSAYLSGMRDGEVQSIRHGKWGVKKDNRGIPYRYWVKGTAFKRKGEVKAKERIWIVTPEVHRALEVLTELAALMIEIQTQDPDLKNGQLLFRRFTDIKRPKGPNASPDASLRQEIGVWINDFQSHVCGLTQSAIDRARSAKNRTSISSQFAIPVGKEGAPWRWTTKQFRRTIAWYIANEPFGTVAGMRQFGQTREVIFQGYAGSPEGGFRDEVERMRLIGQMRDILDMYQDVKQGARLGGPTGARLEKELAAIAKQLGDLPGKVVDESRLLGMLKNVAKVVYPGLLNDCFFDSATALCLKKRGTENYDRPLFAQCDWEKCANSCYSKKHREAFQLSLEDAIAHRSLRGLQKNQRLALDIQIGKFRHAIARIDNGS